MLKKGECTGRVGKAEQVLVEKIGDRVKVTGAYTKKELRELLLSSISLAVDHDSLDEKSKKTLDSTLKKTGIKEADFEILKEDAGHVSAEALETLKDLKITSDMISEAVLKGKRKKGERSLEKLEEKATPQKGFDQLLRDKGLSESLIKELLKNGLTDEYIRLLKALGFTDEEIAELMKIWQAWRKETGKADSFCSVASSSDHYLSPEGIYLKNCLSTPLSDALREVVAKKPFDPVEYVGHWLLHYKICQERKAQRKELDFELRVERERLKMKDMEDIDAIDERGEEEGLLEDWNYVNYGGV